MIELTKKEKARIYSKVSIDPKSGCWNYSGYLSDGYGRIYWRGKRYKAHRFFYEMATGDIPVWEDGKGLEIDHLCRNRACVNFKHLALVTPRTNKLRGKGVGAKNSKKKLCKYGHNAFYWVGNRRRCRECRRIFDASEHRKLWKETRKKV